MKYHVHVRETLHIFSGRIYKVGLIRYVDVPKEITRKLSTGKPHVPVCGTVEGVFLRTTMVSRGKGCHRVAIHGDIRKRLRVDAGAVVEIALGRDEQSREPVLPPFLAMSLGNAPRAQVAFRNMSTALRRQIVRYLTAGKQEATFERRVAKFIQRLEAGTLHDRPKGRSDQNRS